MVDRKVFTLLIVGFAICQLFANVEGSIESICGRNDREDLIPQGAESSVGSNNPELSDAESETVEQRFSHLRVEIPDAPELESSPSPSTASSSAKTPTPKAKTPKTASPKAKTPKAASPKAKTPKAASPKAKTPKAQSPKAPESGSVKDKISRIEAKSKPSTLGKTPSKKGGHK
ncbi:neurofilament medium polypeptide-like [Contarinia nasturtii]|uniref:neurofilament medium polypeptide-like n=1 Tax=Contarinia nasturtii TaxID=265458 RepID=UPI0012D44722|nr:neurofilament medium polypeptide-like [Contarinia nasturtii]